MEQENTDRLWALIARKFSGDANADELAELELLLLKNPREHYSMEILNDLWRSKSQLNRQYSENKYKELVLRMQHIGIDEGKFTNEADSIIVDEEPRSSRSKKWLFWLASFITIGTALFFLIEYNSNADSNIGKQAALPVKNEINTRYGSKTTIVLPDGTKVWLNAGSKMSYDKNYGISLREVNLTGEAYFDVIKNPGKPFVIHTSSINIKVLGTAFNVRCYPDEKNTETSLVRGSLEVTMKDGTEKIILKPNEKLIVSNSDIKADKDNTVTKLNAPEAISKNIMELTHLSILPQDNSIIETSWVNNKLVFRSETFEEVARKMERWYAVEISFTDQRLKSKKLTGIFENETIDQALAAIQLTTPFSYDINNSKIVISK